MDESPFNKLKPEDLQILNCKYKNMDIDELNINIKKWEEKKLCSDQQQILNIARQELQLKYKERQEQIELLTRSLTSSPRIFRWISSVKAIFK